MSSDWVTLEEYRAKALEDFETTVDGATIWAASVKYPDRPIEEVLEGLRPLMRKKIWDAMPAETRLLLMPTAGEVS